ncbi:hypothetical protein [Haloplanus sp. C73]|uniref:hypothetical protein n=1 Tax=Haloplanus sp. C73 TaxID=3421641 RepID=UPI003EB92E74
MEKTYLESQSKLRKADRDEFTKNRHRHPLLVQTGIEALTDDTERFEGHSGYERATGLFDGQLGTAGGVARVRTAGTPPSVEAEQ